MKPNDSLMQEPLPSSDTTVQLRPLEPGSFAQGVVDAIAAGVAKYKAMTPEQQKAFDADRHARLP